MSSWSELLGGLELLASFSPEECREFEGLLSLERFQEGELVCREGEAGNRCFVILEGQIRVEKRHLTGGDADLLASLSPGQMFGQLAIIDAAPRSADCRAGAQTVLYSLSREVYEGLLQSNTPIGWKLQDALARMVAGMLRHANSRLNELATCGTLNEATAQLRQTGAEVRGWS